MAHLEFDIEKIRKNNNLIFQEAVNKFFGMNPEDKYEILFLLYFAKKHWLKVVENGSDDDGYVIETFDRDDYNADGILKEGVSSVSARLYIPDEFKKEHEDFIRYFDASAAQRTNKFTSPYRQDNNVFNKSRYEKIYILDICEDFTSLSEFWYKYDSHDAFNYILLRIAGSLRKGEYLTQPFELTKLVLAILDAKEGTIYNPFSGCCSYAANNTGDLKYVGQEINEMTYILGKLNLMFNDKHNGVCLQEDSVTNWRGNENFDYIVSTPPFDVRIREGKGTKHIEPEILMRSAQDCKKKSVLVLPGSICFTQSAEMSEARRILLENDCLETVIRLPEKTLFGFMIPLFLFVINKEKNKKGVVRFVDASDEFATQRLMNIIDVDNVLALYNGSEEIGKVCDIAIDEIRHNDYNLYPNFYINRNWFKNQSLGNLVSLRRILTPIEKKRISQRNDGVFFIHNIDKSKIILASELSEIDDNNPMYDSVKDFIDDDCLVLRRNILGNNYKSLVYYLKTEKSKVFFSRYNFELLFRVDTSLALPEFILKESEKEYFARQIEGLVSGHNITTDKFLDVKVVLPSIFEQRTMLLESKKEELKEEFDSIKDLYDRRLEDFVYGQRERKHAVNQELNFLLPSIKLIKKFIRNNDSFSKDSVVSKRKGTTLEEYVESMEVEVTKIISMVDNFVALEKFEKADVVPLFDFLNEYCNLKNKNEACKVIFDNIDFYNANYHEPKLYVSIAKNHLTQMLDNLYTNAVKYGFVDNERTDYVLRIYFEKDDSLKTPLVNIKVSNNGKPVSECIDIDRVFDWGVGEGSGIGCWQVKQIAEHFNGTAYYKEYPNDQQGFVSEFVISLPLIESNQL